MKGRIKTWSWRTRLLLVLLVFATAPWVGFALWSMDTLSDTFEEANLEAMTAIAHAKAVAIDQLIEDRRRDVELLATSIAPHLVLLLKAKSETPPPAPVPAPLPLPELEQNQAPSDQSPAGSTPPAPPNGAAPAEAQQPGADAGPPAAQQQSSEAQRTTPLLVNDKPSTPAERKIQEARVTLHQALGLMLWDQRVFEELLVINDAGVVLASTFSKHETKSAQGLPYFDKGLKTTYLQSVFISPITGSPSMVIATPIRHNESHVVIGVLAARLNLTRFFRLINDLTGLGKTGETVVVQKIENDFVFMAPTRHDDKALNRKVPTQADGYTALQEAVGGHSNFGQRTDYRNQRTLAAWKPVPTLGWGLMVKIDYDEAMRMVYEMRSRTILVAAGLLIATFLAAFLVSREFVGPLRKLKSAADRISRGDLDVQLEIHSNDEIGELADSFERMVAAIKFFREHARHADEEDLGDEAGDPSLETEQQ